nr:LysR family transcriptional regulator [Rhodoferax sp.]
MKLHLLRYFTVLAEELHFGRAAARLAMTQPPLSSAIKALEEELGVRLLERDSKHVRLTPAGSAFLSEARVILERVARAGETARAVAGGLRGRLDIGFTGSMVYREMPRIVHLFQERMPGIEVILREMSTTEQVDALLHGQLHAGFINAASVPGPLSSLALLDDPLVCCLPENHPLASAPALDLSQLADEQFVMFARDVAPANHDNVIATFSRACIHPRTCHAARQWLTVVALVSAGMGVSLVPASLAKSGVQGACFVPLSDHAARSSALLAWRAESTVAALGSFVEAARSELS